jgi:hypothetical protein
MLLSDTHSLARDCKIILSHAGGTLPYLNDRVAGMLSRTPFVVNKIASEIIELAKLFYFNTVLDLLRKFAKKGHVLFGSIFQIRQMRRLNIMLSSWRDMVVSRLGRRLRTRMRPSCFQSWEIGVAKRVFTV